MSDFRDQIRKAVGDLRGFEIGTRHDRAGWLQPKGAGEDRQATQDRAFELG
jgi:hypothetical protein